MKPENILKSSALDIIFENKNKEYGAYPLRKFYPNRLKKSIGITMLLVLVFAGLQSWKTPKKVVDIYVSDVISIDNFKQPVEKEKEKPKEQATSAKKKMAEVVFTTPIITPNDKVKTTMPENSQIDTTFIGNKFNPIGGQDSGFVGTKPGDPKELPVTRGNPEIADPIDESPTFNPSVMPEFPGGIESLKRFMLGNLRQPDDISEGEKFIVLVQFVVDKAGNISDIQILQNGREDLDAEVTRVINKMPKWKPGVQNGFPVAVYYKMPITFVNNN